MSYLSGFLSTILFLLCTLGQVHAENALDIKKIKRRPTYVYITVDDGPIYGTKRLVKIAESLQTGISMLLVGEQIIHSEEHRAWLKLARSSGYVFPGNHSFSHAHDHYHRFYLDPENVLRDFERSQSVLGLTSKVARLPGRNMWEFEGYSKYDISNGITSAQLFYKNGYEVIGWDVE